MEFLKHTEERLLRYDFSAVELHELSVKLANRHREKAAVAADKKAAQSQFDSQLKAIDADVDSLSNKVSSGHEYRKVECQVKYHIPEQGKKTILRSDNGDKIVEKMTSEEWNLFNQEQVDDKKKVEKKD